MKMDMANYTIQQIRPFLQQQSAEYERKKFQEFLEVQQGMFTDSFRSTKILIFSSIVLCLENPNLVIFLKDNNLAITV